MSDAALGFALPCEPERACMSPDGRATWPVGRTEMGRATGAREPDSRATAALVARELAALGAMTSAELAAKYEDLLGRPSRTRNAQHLRKRLAWEIQARIEGGLSETALARIEALGKMAPSGWKGCLSGRGERAGPKATAVPSRDPRIPPAGTVLARTHEGAEHRVTVLADGFEYQGERSRSLSMVARLITGTAWNGYHFFFGRAGGTRKRPGAVPT